MLKYLFWIDTRDMVSDGLTKGAVDRELLHKLMNGIFSLSHEYEQWHCKKRLDFSSSSTKPEQAEAEGESENQGVETHLSLFVFARSRFQQPVALRPGLAPTLAASAPRRAPGTSVSGAMPVAPTLK